MQNPLRFQPEMGVPLPLETRREDMSREIMEHIVRGAVLKTRLAAREHATPDVLLTMLFRSMAEFGAYVTASGRYQNEAVQRASDIVLEELNPAWRAVIPYYMSLLAQGASPADFESRFAMFAHSEAPFFREFAPIRPATFSGNWAAPEEPEDVEDAEEPAEGSAPVAVHAPRSSVSSVIGSLRERLAGATASLNWKYALAAVALAAPLFFGPLKSRMESESVTSRASAPVASLLESIRARFDAIQLPSNDSAESAQGSLENETPEAAAKSYELQVARRGSLSESVKEFALERARAKLGEQGIRVSNSRLERRFHKQFTGGRMYGLVQQVLASTGENARLTKRFERNRDFPVPPGLKFYVAADTPAIDEAVSALIEPFQTARERVGWLGRLRSALRT